MSTLTTIAMLVLIIGGMLGTYLLGFSAGRREGWSTGKEEGYADGYDRGKRDHESQQEEDGEKDDQPSHWQSALALVTVMIVTIAVLSVMSSLLGTD